MSDDEIIDEFDISELYEQSLVNREAEERAEIIVSLMQDLTVLGVNHYYLEKISKSVFKAKTADLDNKKLLYLKKILEDRIGKLIVDKKINVSDTKQFYI
jgi:L-lysine 2,3-aminomutase